MKALTTFQPWVGLIAAGAKPFEFRTWKADSVVGERIVLHASVRKPDRDATIWEVSARIRDGREGYGLKRPEALAFFETLKARLLAREPLGLPLGAGLGTVRVGVPRRVRDIDGRALGIDLSGVREDLYGWPMEAFEPFPAPVACLGAQGLWTWPYDIVRAA